MATVFVITGGSYSDYRIRAVFTTKKKAEAYKALFKDSDDLNDVEEYTLNPNTVDLVSKGYSPWLVLMLRDGTVERIERQEISPYSVEDVFNIWKRSKAPACFEPNTPDCLDVSVMARTAKHAIKIVNEHRVQMIAMGKWK